MPSAEDMESEAAPHPGAPPPTSTNAGFLVATNLSNSQEEEGRDMFFPGRVCTIQITKRSPIRHQHWLAPGRASRVTMRRMTMASFKRAEKRLDRPRRINKLGDRATNFHLSPKSTREHLATSPDWLEKDPSPSPVLIHCRASFAAPCFLNLTHMISSRVQISFVQVLPRLSCPLPCPLCVGKAREVIIGLLEWMHRDRTGVQAIRLPLHTFDLLQ